MYKLITLELRRNSLRPYNFAVLFSGVTLLGLLYLFAVIPRLQPTETDLEMFLSYENMAGLTNIICMVIFLILSAAMSAKFIVGEYTGKRVILLFSYPVKRQSILGSKIFMVFVYTVISMILCGAAVFGIFFLTESLFRISSDQLTLHTLLNSLLSLVCCAIIAGVWGIIALWFGFRKESVSVTIIAAVIIAVVICQVLSITMSSLIGLAAFLIIGAIGALFAVRSLTNRVAKKEV